MMCKSYKIVKFHTKYFIEYIYKDTQNYCWLLLISGLYFRSKSFTTYRITI